MKHSLNRCPFFLLYTYVFSREVGKGENIYTDVLINASVPLSDVVKIGLNFVGRGAFEKCIMCVPGIHC